MPFRDEVSRALASLGAAGVVADAVADPGGAARALEAEKALILRVWPELGPGSETHGPPPADPLWLRLERGSREVTLAPLRGGPAQKARAAGVVVETRTTSCCDA